MKRAILAAAAALTLAATGHAQPYQPGSPAEACYEAGLNGQPPLAICNQPGAPAYTAGVEARRTRGDAFDPDDASTRLNDGMTIAQVEQVVGYRPTSVQETTCGGQNGPPWTCRVLTWGSPFHALVAWFQQEGAGPWVINSWEVR